MNKNNKEKNLEELLGVIKSKGMVNEKPDVLGHIAMKEKVYVKRVEFSDGFQFKCASISSSKEDFSDVGSSDVRLNTVNRDGVWTSVFAIEVPSETLSEVVEAALKL